MVRTVRAVMRDLSFGITTWQLMAMGTVPLGTTAVSNPASTSVERKFTGIDLEGGSQRGFGIRLVRPVSKCESMLPAT